jgi:hypothetical protein
MDDDHHDHLPSTSLTPLRLPGNETGSAQPQRLAAVRGMREQLSLLKQRREEYFSLETRLDSFTDEPRWDAQVSRDLVAGCALN